MIKTVDNFIGLANNTKTVKQLENFFINSYSCEIAKSYKNELNITLSDYQNKNPNNSFFSFFKDEDKINSKNEDDVIISIKKDGDNYLAQSGNYVGEFIWDDGSKNGLKIDIKSRFSNTFLERMLNFANDVFLDDVSVSGNNSKNDLGISKYIIYYMFVQNLEKAFLLGLPKGYRSIKHHEMKLKGKIDINSFIKYDIPFQGRVSSLSREQKEISEIIDVLYKAVNIIYKSKKFSLKNISHIKTHLKQHKSNKYVSNETINKALKSKALQNPIFSPYKKVLEYARFIINGDNIEQNKDGKNNTYGFLINVAELFEIYVTKLLQNRFPNWTVKSPSIWLADEFDKSYMYQRRIIPDIVMIENETNKVMVFDTKYKKMKFRSNTFGSGSDIDRCDFFQINTYMNFYNNQPKYNLIAGGLLYPIEENKYGISNSHSETWFGQNETKFIVDGIDLSKLEESKYCENIFDPLIKREMMFIERINELI